jgi:DNA-binding response OmpR family regulator
MAKNILVVDDEAHILKAMEIALSGHGFNIQTASGAYQAWNIIDKNTDLLLLDIMMPGMRPIDLLRKIQESKLSRIKCIYVSAVPFTEEQRKEMIKEGLVVDFIQKPFDNNDLLARVKRALGEETS